MFTISSVAGVALVYREFDCMTRPGPAVAFLAGIILTVLGVSLLQSGKSDVIALDEEELENLIHANDADAGEGLPVVPEDSDSPSADPAGIRAGSSAADRGGEEEGKGGPMSKVAIVWNAHPFPGLTKALSHPLPRGDDAEEDSPLPPIRSLSTEGDVPRQRSRAGIAVVSLSGAVIFMPLEGKDEKSRTRASVATWPQTDSRPGTLSSAVPHVRPMRQTPMVLSLPSHYVELPPASPSSPPLPPPTATWPLPLERESSMTTMYNMVRSNSLLQPSRLKYPPSIPAATGLALAAQRPDGGGMEKGGSVAQGPPDATQKTGTMPAMVLPQSAAETVRCASVSRSLSLSLSLCHGRILFCHRHCSPLP